MLKGHVNEGPDWKAEAVNQVMQENSAEQSDHQRQGASDKKR